MPKEYIEREALLEEFSLIVNDCLNEDSARGDAIAAAFLRMMNSQIMTYPAADAVKVVRCEKCKFGEYDEEENKILCIRIKNIGDGELYVYNEPHDYCSYGERKEQDNA